MTLKAPSAGIYPHDCRPAERPSTGEPVDRRRSVNGDAKLDALGNGTSVGLPPTQAASVERLPYRASHCQQGI